MIVKDNIVSELIFNGVFALYGIMENAIMSNSLTTTEGEKLAPLHPGEILSLEFMLPMNISQSSLSRHLNVPFGRIHEICAGKRGITPDTALRLAHFFDMSAEFWLNLQVRYDLEMLKDKFAQDIKQEIRPYQFKATLKDDPYPSHK